VIPSLIPKTTTLAISAMASSSSNVVGVHYRVGKKIGEGSFGVIFEGTNLLNNQQVAIKFVRDLGFFPCVMEGYLYTD
jgi:RIO-like serine/threonine protein kinase